MTIPATSRALLGVALGVGLLAGAGATYLSLAPRNRAPSTVVGTAPAPPPTSKGGADSVMLGPEEVTRAHISTTAVESAALSESVTIPALVEPNAYKQTIVTALVAGRVTRVQAELGRVVRRGEVLAEVYSPELAEAQRAYISVSSELRAHEQQLARVEALVAIGSASRQEVEMAHAEHSALTSSLEGARTRLELIGLTSDQVADLSTASQVTATTAVRAPLDGVVTARQANVGLNVAGATALFTVTDLSTVWVVGDLYERDFPRVGVGRAVTITADGFPGLTWPSAIDYIDPQLNRETRTASVRAEVRNPRQQLRLGMYAQMRIDTIGDQTMPVIPTSAVQTIGDHAVVYVASADTPGLYIERPIQIGVAAGGRMAVVSGVAVGESVVSAGSFYLRAEHERRGQGTHAPAPERAPSGQSTGPARQTARITTSDKGFEPAHLILKSGVPALVTFIRTTDATCAKEVVFPSLNIRRELPLDTPVTIELTPSHANLDFVCGMGMFKGTITAE
ncbi:MAG: efflux RND transporter periplasmic adaptor subunit [Vicinamibacterales bacterium]